MATATTPTDERLEFIRMLYRDESAYSDHVNISRLRELNIRTVESVAIKSYDHKNQGHIKVLKPMAQEILDIAKNGGKVLLADRAWLRFRATQRKVFIYDCAFEDVDDLDNIVADLKYYHPEQSIVAVNEPPGTDLCAALASLNWVESAPQWEMHYVPE